MNIIPEKNEIRKLFNFMKAYIYLSKISNNISNTYHDLYISFVNPQSYSEI